MHVLLSLYMCVLYGSAVSTCRLSMCVCCVSVESCLVSITRLVVNAIHTCTPIALFMTL